MCIFEMTTMEFCDPDVDLRFGKIYAILLLLSKAVLGCLGLFFISEPPLTSQGFSQFVQALLSPVFLFLHAVLTIASIYVAKNISGHKKSLSLPHHTKPIRGDPTKGPLIRRLVLRFKAFVFRISPLKTILHGSLILILSWMLAVYVIVCFGAPAFSDHYQTSTFAAFLVIQTAFPIILIYGPETDNSGGLAHILLSQQDKLKVTEPLGRQLFIDFCCGVFGAWVGALPIPLDWDRPWQKWPISCAAGALLGSSLANLYSATVFLCDFKRSGSSQSKKKRS